MYVILCIMFSCFQWKPIHLLLREQCCYLIIFIFRLKFISSNENYLSLWLIWHDMLLLLDLDTDNPFSMRGDGVELEMNKYIHIFRNFSFALNIPHHFGMHLKRHSGCRWKHLTTLLCFCFQTKTKTRRKNVLSIEYGLHWAAIVPFMKQKSASGIVG